LEIPSSSIERHQQTEIELLEMLGLGAPDWREAPSLKMTTARVPPT